MEDSQARKLALVARVAESSAVVAEMNAKGLMQPEDRAPNGIGYRWEWEKLLKYQVLLLNTTNRREDDDALIPLDGRVQDAHAAAPRA